MRFAVATFQRVFDTSPNRDVISLERLVEGLTTFMLKPKTRDAVAREEANIERAWQAFQAGDYLAGRYWSRLERVRKERGGDGHDGHDVAPADLEDEYQHMLRDARAAPKRDLRLWSPALYPPAVKRGGENVLHLSCLVLDYDSGVSVEEAAEAWAPWFHIVHSTWSHTPEHAKFRLILPLGEPVRPVDWYTVYGWAQERTGMTVDPTGKSVGSTFALPAVAAAELPRIALSSPGPLLEPRLEGLIEDSAEPPPEGIEPDEPNHFRIPIPGHRRVQGSWGADADGAVPEAIDGENESAKGDDEDWDDSVFPWT